MQRRDFSLCLELKKAASSVSHKESFSFAAHIGLFNMHLVLFYSLGSFCPGPWVHYLHRFRTIHFPTAHPGVLKGHLADTNCNGCQASRLPPHLLVVVAVAILAVNG
jgi:hypothetical protein